MLLRSLRLLSILLLLAACSEERKASGEPDPVVEKKPLEARGGEKTLEKAIPQFSGVKTRGRILLKVVQGEGGKAVIRGPENYLEHLKVAVEKGKAPDGSDIDVLVVLFERRVKSKGLVVEVTTPSLRSVEALGVSDVEVGPFMASRLDVVAKGATKVQLEAGSYGQLYATAEQMSRILAKQVMVEEAHAKATGKRGRVVLGEIARLKQVSEEGGKVTFLGDPEMLK